MALKLQVPWRTAPLSVQYTGLDGVIDEIRDSNSPNVDPCGNDGVLVKDFFGMNNRVPDVSRYRICNSGCCVRHDNRYSMSNGRYIIPHCDISGQRLQDLLREQQIQEKQIGNIVLILESPHKDEYQPGNINCPIAPANGDTGHNIDRYLATVLSRIEMKEGQQLIVPSSHVVISNPIQFQTSLHAIHGKSLEGTWETLRNNVWWTLWNNSEGHIKQCFRERLVYTYNPSLIINACSGKFTPCEYRTCTHRQRRNLKDRKRNVTKFVREELPKVPLYETYHPARDNWTNCARNNWTNCDSTTCLQRIPPLTHNAGNP